MLIGLAVGLSVAAAIYVSDRQPRTAPAAGPAPVAQPSPAEKAAPGRQAEPAPRSRFQFYDMLPNFEVVIPEEDFEVRRARPAEPVAAPGIYVLQAGSFSNFADADRMKARLAMLGIVSRIQKVTVDDKAYHRVRVGPVEELGRLNEIRTQLGEASIDVMVIRVGE